MPGRPIAINKALYGGVSSAIFSGPWSRALRYPHRCAPKLHIGCYPGSPAFRHAQDGTGHLKILCLALPPIESY
jgi:hypothetical protein